MANKDQLKILKSGVDEWNKWREENINVRIDLHNANLSSAELSNANLRNADLHNANLHNANLRNAELSNANLSSADLSFANLSNANLSSADLSFAELSDAELSSAELSFANLSSADLSSANLSFANLRNAELSSADLSFANLSDADLNITDFKDCRIGRTIFGLTNLSTAKNLNTVQVAVECTIDFQTLRDSKNIPKEFLFKIGLPENYINYLPDFYEEEGIRLYPVFLSHAHKDKEFATRLYEALIERKVRVWFDERELLPGDDIRKGISKGISLYDKFIIVCSENSLKDSWWVDEEINRALKKNEKLYKELGKKVETIIPVTIDDFIFDGWKSEIKENLDRYIVGDFKDWKDDVKFNKALDKLVSALNADRKDSTPPSFLK